MVEFGRVGNLIFCYRFEVKNVRFVKYDDLIIFIVKYKFFVMKI